MSTLRSALDESSKATTIKTRAAATSYFAKWEHFCTEHGTDCALTTILDPETQVCYILMFAAMYRERKGPTGDPVRSKTVGKACSAVGKGISDLAGFNPCKQTQGFNELHPLLASYLKRLSDLDKPSTRAYPINLAIIENLYEALDTTDAKYGTMNEHIINLCVMAWFWLMRPAEYCDTGDPEATRSQAFRLRDVTLTIGNITYPATTAPLNDSMISRITSACLTFDDQKSAVRGETIAQRANSHPHLCGAKAVGRLCLHLRQHNASPDTPLHRHYNDHPEHKKWYDTPSRFITNALQHSAMDLEPSTGIPWERCTAKGIRPGAATALLCAGVDTDRIGLLGRWRSDAMLRYLRIQAANQNASQQMLDHGRFTFAPGAFQVEDPLPKEVPAHYINLLAQTELLDLTDED